MGLSVGIDLGTTNSALAYVDQYGRPVVVNNNEGSNMTPSVICFRNDDIIVGDEAKELQGCGFPEVSAFFKRHMGDPGFTFYGGGRDWTPTELSSLILKKLKHDAELQLGQKITDAVITVPAYFKNAQREATISAGRKAGLNVLQVINEPTAAAIAYGFNKKGQKGTLLVYDLGGGTFDITLLQIQSQEIRILSSDGDYQLGGKDWDDIIVEYFASCFEKRFNTDPMEDLESLSELLIRAEEAKKRLSKVKNAKLSLFHAGQRGEFELDRNSFNDLTAHLMERTVAILRQILFNKQMSPKHIDDVLLVGGSTRMPMVSEFIRKEFGRVPLQGVNVDEAVALGAALLANERASNYNDSHLNISNFSLPGSVKAIDVTNHTLGMIALNQDRSAYLNAYILEKDRPIPCNESRSFSYNNPKDCEIYMTQGESRTPQNLDYLGLWVIKDIPEMRDEIVVDIKYAYTESGTVDVSATIVESGTPLKIEKQSLPPDVPERFFRPPEFEEPLVTPLSVYMAFDLSGSMKGAPIEAAKCAAHGFIDNLDLQNCKVGIIAFSENSRIKLKTTPDEKSIRRSIDSLQVGETGGLNVTDPFRDIHVELQNVKGRRLAIVLADGVWENQSAAIKRARKCHQNEIHIIAIGFGQADEIFLRKIASTDDMSLLTTQDKLAETFCSIARVLESTSGNASVPEKINGHFLSSLFRK